jgi:hypothetical protein
LFKVLLFQKRRLWQWRWKRKMQWLWQICELKVKERTGRTWLHKPNQSLRLWFLCYKNLKAKWHQVKH